MTMEQKFNEYKTRYEIKKENLVRIFKIRNTNVLFWQNGNKVFKMSRELYGTLAKDTDMYFLLFFGKRGEKHYYIKFSRKYNWLRYESLNCDKLETVLKEQVFNDPITLNHIVSDLVKYSNG